TPTRLGVNSGVAPYRQTRLRVALGTVWVWCSAVLRTIAGSDLACFCRQNFECRTGALGISVHIRWDWHHSRRSDPGISSRRYTKRTFVRNWNIDLGSSCVELCPKPRPAALDGCPARSGTGANAGCNHNDHTLAAACT